VSPAKPLHPRRSGNASWERLHREGLPGPLPSDRCLTGHATVGPTVAHGIAEAWDADLSASLGVARSAQLPWGRPPEATRRGRAPRAWSTPYGRLATRRVPTRRRGHGAGHGPSLPRSAPGWGPRLAHQGLGSWVGPRRREGPAARAWPRGASRARAAGHRLGSRGAKPRAACPPRPLAPPPPLVRVDGLGGKRASPTGARSDDTRGWRRAGTRPQTRVGLRARGGWPAGPWAIGPGPRATGATAAPWHACVGARARPGLTETTPPVGGRDGSHGRASAWASPRDGVAPQRGLCHPRPPRADPRGCGARAGPAVAGAAHAPRPAKRQRQTAVVVEARQVAESAGAAARRAPADVVRETWHGREPQAGAHFCCALAKTFAAVASDCPQPLAALIRTTNQSARTLSAREASKAT